MQANKPSVMSNVIGELNNNNSNNNDNNVTEWNLLT